MLSTEMLTKSVYFMLFEAGISLVAVNLPSIWLVFGTLAPKAILRSVRSVRSLASGVSGRSRDSQYQKTADGQKSSTSVSSTADLSNPSSETYAMQDLEHPDVPHLPGNKIYIHNTIHLSSEQRR